MKTIVQFFLKNNKLTVMVSLFVALFGFIGLGNLNSESFPVVNFATAIIETNYRGAAPEDIETKITKPIEDKIREVSGLKDVRSVSQSGKSTIIVRVDMDNEDVDEVMSDLEKKVNQVSELPPDLLEDPKFTEINTEEFPAIQIALVGSNENRKRDLIADALKEDLEDNKRIKEVILSGFTKREFDIELDQKKLARNHISVSEVLAKVSSRNVNIPGGDLIDGPNKQLVRVQAKVRNTDDLRNLLIRSNFSGEGIYLKDVADVRDASEEPRYLSRYNGQEATILIVNKKGGADTIKLVEEVDSIIKRYEEKYKDQYKLSVYNNEAEKVKNRLEILSSNAISGLILVIVFLLIFLPGRIGIVASASLPLAIMGTFGLMPAMGMNLDAITILALVIALGMLVDNSVVISENFTRLRKEGLSSFDAAVQSVSMLALPITATAFTTIGAFLPMLVTRGIMGEFIKFIPIVVTISLLLSLVESFFLLPLRLRWAGEKVKPVHEEVDEKKKSDWFDGFIKKFESVMRVLVKRRYLTAVGFTGMLLVAFGFMGANKFILFPAEQTEIYLSRYETKIGTTLEETNRLAAVLSNRVKEALGDDVKSIVAKTGSSQENPSDPLGKEGKNAGILTILVTDQAKFDLDYRDALKKLRAIEISEFKEVTFSAQINGPPVGSPVNATFRSNQGESLDQMIQKMMAKLNSIDGVFDVKVNDEFGDGEIFVEIDYVTADQLGLSVEEIGNTVRTALSGTVVSDVTLDNKDVDLRVRFKSEDRNKVNDIQNIEILDKRGNLVPISQVAKFREAGGTATIKRFDFKRARTVTANIDETKIDSPRANALLLKAFEEESGNHPDVSLVFGGEEESTKESMESLGEAMMLALVAIFCLMVFVFNSYLRPLIIMSTIPLGLVGFSISFLLHGRPISFLAMIGIVGLAGIIVNSGIVLISFIENMKEEGKMPLDEILVKASGMRLRAVLVTSLTTISGLFPTAYGIGGSDAILVPMTLAMAWGLTSGTILTLLWVPCAYAILEDFNGVVNRFFSKPIRIRGPITFPNRVSTDQAPLDEGEKESVEKMESGKRA